MKKILIITGIFPPDIGGPASYGAVLAKKLSQNSKVVVLTYSSKISQKNLDNNFKVIRIWRKLPWFIRHPLFFLRGILAASSADTILSLNSVSAGLTSLIGAKLFRKIFILRIVGDYAWEMAMVKNRTHLLIDDFQKEKKTGKTGFLDKVQKLVARKADRIIVPSNYLAKMVKGWDVKEGKVSVIYNGVDFKPSALSKEEARRKIGIFGHIIVSAGRLVPWKGFRMLIKIMPQIADINQAFRLIIIGDGPERRMLEVMVKNLGLEKKVSLVGSKSREDLAVYLAAADMFVLNTGYEGFSHQILEAMIAGVPIITTAVGGNKEMVRQGENGFMIRYNDEFNLVEAIKTLWQDHDFREKFTENGKKTAGKFSIEKMYDETLKLITENG